jgi:hypothetical protein
MAPLGYDTKDRRITVNEAEAAPVRTIFSSYLKLGSLNLLMADLRKRGIVTKVRTLKSGEKIGGIPFTRGSLAHLLRNRFYAGEVAFKAEVLRGEQTAISGARCERRRGLSGVSKRCARFPRDAIPRQVTSKCGRDARWA